MKPASLHLFERIYIIGVVLVFGLIVLHAPISVFFSVHFGHDLLVKSWKEILMAVLLVMAVIIITRRHAWALFRKDPFIIASAALALLYIVSLQYAHGTASYGAGILIDLRYILYAVLAYVAVKLFPEQRSLFVRIGLISAIVVVGFGLLQFILPKDFLSVLGYSKLTITPYTTIDNYQGLPRLQSTMRGPNPLGAYTLIVALVAGVAAVRARVTRQQRIWLTVLTIAALVVLFGSYSRSAYIGVVVGGVIAGVCLLGHKRLVSKKILVIAGVCVVVLVAGFFAIRGTTFYSSVLRHEVAGSGPAINSDDGHSLSLKDGIKAVATHPFGYGTGSTGSASLLSDNGYIVENQYLYVAHEAGWLALVLFLAIYGLLLWRAYQQRHDWLALGVFASGVGLAIVGLLLPVFADDTVSIIWFGAAALVAGGKHGQRATK